MPIKIISKRPGILLRPERKKNWIIILVDSKPNNTNKICPQYRKDLNHSFILNKGNLVIFLHVNFITLLDNYYIYMYMTVERLNMKFYTFKSWMMVK